MTYYEEQEESWYISWFFFIVLFVIPPLVRPVGITLFVIAMFLLGLYLG